MDNNNEKRKQDLNDLIKQANSVTEKAVLREGAIASYKMYLAYCEAGFTKAEALSLVAQIIAYGGQIQNGKGQS